jgi:hypothetical protein
MRVFIDEEKEAQNRSIGGGDGKFEFIVRA